MSKTIELSDDRYAELERAAIARGQTLAQLLDDLVADVTRERRVYDNLDDFFRSLGMTEEDLAASREMAEQPEIYFPDDAAEEASARLPASSERATDADV